MVCWEGNFKINNFQKKICQPRSSVKVPVWNSFSQQVSFFVTIGFSHIVITLEEAYWNTHGLEQSAFLETGRLFLSNKVHVYRFTKYDSYASKGCNLRGFL